MKRAQMGQAGEQLPAPARGGGQHPQNVSTSFRFWVCTADLEDELIRALGLAPSTACSVAVNRRSRRPRYRGGRWISGAAGK
jgi:hypothetical protein